jgi:Firmicute plasmid replication protein (RepL)
MNRKNPLAERPAAKKRPKKLVRVDTKVGVPAVPREKIYKFEGGFCIMGLLSLEQVLVRYSRDLSKESWLMFLLLCTRLDLRENKVVVNQAEIGRLMGLPRQSVQRAIKQLIEVELIFEGPKEKRSRTYSLSPEIVFRGSAKDHAKELAKYRKRKAKARMKLVDGGKPR